MTISSPKAMENGERWLWQLTYGAEKAFQLNQALEKATGLSFTKNTKGRDARRLCRHADPHLLHKLATTETIVDKLLGSTLLVMPLPESDLAEPVEGPLTGFDFDQATISIKGAGRLAVVRYCEHQFDENARRLSMTPFVELQTDSPI